MGKKNPIKQVIQASGSLAGGEIREIARAVGADGVVKGMEDMQKVHDGIGIGAVDLVNNEKGKQQKKVDIAKDETSRRDAAVAADNTAKQQAADYAASETTRMGAGSKSRTLLTGPKGLEDEDGTTISRRTLRAR